MISWKNIFFFKELKHQFLVNQHASSILRTNLGGDDIIPTAQIWDSKVRHTSESHTEATEAASTDACVSLACNMEAKPKAL